MIELKLLMTLEALEGVLEVSSCGKAKAEVEPFGLVSVGVQFISSDSIDCTGFTEVKMKRSLHSQAQLHSGLKHS